MWKPVAVLVSLIAGIGFALVTVDRTVVHTTALGEPLDHPGVAIACPLCRNGVGEWQGTGYDYRCDACGAKYRARWYVETGEIETDW